MVKGRYHKVAFNLLSSVIYFLLFSIQLSGRFYSVANFCVYQGSHGGSMEGRLSSEANDSSGLGTHWALYETPSSNRQHLSVDKRYQAEGFLALAAGPVSLPIPCYTFIPRKTGTILSFWVSPFTTVNSLRGPPVC